MRTLRGRNKAERSTLAAFFSGVPKTFYIERKRRERERERGGRKREGGRKRREKEEREEREREGRRERERDSCYNVTYSCQTNRLITDSKIQIWHTSSTYIIQNYFESSKHTK